MSFGPIVICFFVALFWIVAYLLFKNVGGEGIISQTFGKMVDDEKKRQSGE